MFAKKMQEQTLKSTQHIVDEALDKVASSVHEIRQQVKPLMCRAGEQVSSLVHGGVDGVLDTSRHLSDQAMIATRRATRYAKDEPVKTMLMAAAIGVVAVALVKLIGRSHEHR